MDVVMAVARNLVGLHWKQRLSTVQRLDLCLLVDAKHDGLLGRVQVEPDDVGDLLFQHRVVAVLERPDQMGLETHVPPDVVDEPAAATEVCREHPRAPTGDSAGADDFFDKALTVGGSLTTAGSVVETVDPGLLKTSAPFQHRWFGRPQLRREHLVGDPVTCEENDPRPHNLPMRNDLAPRPGFENCPLLGGNA